MWDLFISQNKKCALTGVDINIVNTTISHNYLINTASLDRIDNNKGYIKGNVRWLHKIVNQIKSDIEDRDLIYICHLISIYNPQPQNRDINQISSGKKRSSSEQTKKRMKDSNPHKRPIIQLDLKGNLLKEWGSINKARDYYQYKSEMGIIGTCKGRQKSSGGYIWKYKN